MVGTQLVVDVWPAFVMIVGTRKSGRMALRPVCWQVTCRCGIGICRPFS